MDTFRQDRTKRLSALLRADPQGHLERLQPLRPMSAVLRTRPCSHLAGGGDFLATVRGEGISDAVLQRLNTVSTVESRGTPRVDTATNVLHGDHAGYVVELAAADAESAREILTEVLGEDLVGDIKLVEL